MTFPGNNEIVGFMQVNCRLIRSYIRLLISFQPRFVDGQFNLTDPRHCSIHDPAKATCFLNAQRHDGFYESSPIVVCTMGPLTAVYIVTRPLNSTLNTCLTIPPS